MDNLKETTETRYHKNFTYYTNDQIIGRSLKLYGEYQQIEINFLLNIINSITNKPVVVYDIGSNIGNHAVAFASTGAKVYCFEPNPLNFELLEQNTKGLDNVYLHRAAVTNVAGNILVHSFDPAVPGNYGKLLINKESGVETKAVRLDDVEDLPDPHVIKIDAAGSELGVIQGCLDKIKKSLPAVYYEAHESPNFDKLYNILTGLGYHLYWACVFNHNKNNFKGNADNNMFDDSAMFSVLAVPPGWNKLTDIAPVYGPNDHWSRLINLL